MESLGTTNAWLAVLAIVSLLEFLMMIAAGLLAYRMYRRALTVVESVERVHIVPLRARIDDVLDDVQLIVARLKHTQESVGTALTHLSQVAALVAVATKAKAWPLVGIVNGVRMAVATFKK